MSDILPATAILEIEMEEPKIIQIGNYKPSGHACGRVVSIDGLSPTVMENHGAATAIAEPCILGYTRDDKGDVQSYHEKDVAGTIHTSSGSGGNTDQFVKIHYRIRKLTPRECFRLMDVDDADIDKIDAYRIKTTLKNGTVKEKPIPKSQKYKMAANSIVVSCLYHIFHQMFIAEPPKPQPIQPSLFD